MKLIAFGITGDLMRLKILPALAGLYIKGQLEGVEVIGISRKPWSDAELREYIQSVVSDAESSFYERFTFLQGDTSDKETFERIKERVGNEEVLFYFCISPLLYMEAFEYMKEVGFSRNVKVMVEKPFGRSGEEAEKLWEVLKEITGEENIYLVDHYAAKDWVRELGNVDIDRGEIAEIMVLLFETTGVEKRGATYDKLGTLRDVGQNHMLNMLTKLVPLPTVVGTTITRTQYECYKEIPGVAPDSHTETYFKITTVSEGIKITLEAGKKMSENKKEVEITYKDGTRKTFSEYKNTVPEYELLFEAVMSGNKKLFPSIDEVRAQWKFIDHLL